MNPAEFANIARSEATLWWYRGQRRILARFLEPIVLGRGVRDVLEAGCGTGYQARVFESEFGWRVVPFDLDATGLRHGRAYGLGRLCQGDLARLPFASEAFDAAVSLDVLVHFPKGTELEPLQELARVLRPGGLLVVRVSALDALRSRHSEHAAERQRFTRRRLLHAVRLAGLRPVRCTYANSLLMPVALVKFRVWEPMLRRPPASGVRPVARWMDAMLHAPLAMESRIVGSGVDLPLGQSLLLAAEKPGGAAS